MNLVIGESEYPLTESITEATLSDLLVVAKESKKLGAEVSVRTLREYVSQHLMLAEDGFEFVDGAERVVAFLSVIYLCRRHAGETVSFADGNDVKLEQLRLSVTVEDEPTESEAADPKAPTDSAPAGEGATTTT